LNYKKNPDPRKQLSDAKQCAKKNSKKDLSNRFLEEWLKHGLPKPEQEYQFHPERKWRFDYAFVDEKLAIEIDGGAFVGGGHGRAIQQAKDYEKQNMAVSYGWRVLRFNTHSLKDLGLCVRQAALVLCGEKIE
jgi:very-short-patch-repair endonuclease